VFINTKYYFAFSRNTYSSKAENKAAMINIETIKNKLYKLEANQKYQQIFEKLMSLNSETGFSTDTAESKQSLYLLSFW